MQMHYQRKKASRIINDLRISSDDFDKEISSDDFDEEASNEYSCKFDQSDEKASDKE